MVRGEMFVLSAPSGTGKNTLIEAVLGRLDGLEHSISHTTREPRRGETDGDPYHFVDRPTFMALVEQGVFLEWAEYNDNLYGTSVHEIDSRLDRGVDVLMEDEGVSGDAFGGELAVDRAGEVVAADVKVASDDVDEGGGVGDRGAGDDPRGEAIALVKGSANGG